jgi:ABC-type Mn2+/Zn2+ transport system ATPase subunit
VIEPSDPPGSALAVADLSVSYGSRPVLRDVTFEVGWGELIAVIGPNGAGKSTLFKAICGLVPSTGTVGLGGIHCHHRRDRMAAAYVPQRNDLDLDFPATVGEVVLSGRRRFLRWWERPGPSDRSKALEALETVDMAGTASRPIGALSGGQVQRVFMARALAQEARILLLDEALSGVDAPSTLAFLDLFGDLTRSGTTVLLATHDLALARRRFTRAIAVNHTVIADGPPGAALDGDALDATFGSGALPVVRAGATAS